MLYYAIILLIIALIAGILGFGVIAGTAALVAKIFFAIFIVMAIATMLRIKKPLGKPSDPTAKL